MYHVKTIKPIIIIIIRDLFKIASKSLRFDHLMRKRMVK